jgi:2'-hydroxyisoflavone reductase
MLSGKKLNDVLILGGTQFIGVAFVERGLSLQQHLTLFNRQKTNAGLYREISIIGDRDSAHDIAKVADRHWDVVIDLSGFDQRAVELSTQLLTSVAEKYVFLSSSSVYAYIDDPKHLVDEQGELLKADKRDPRTLCADGRFNWANYGSNKVLCEKIVNESFGNRALIIRAGKVIGPRDIHDRFVYWIRRIAKGGEVLIPKGNQTPIQIIDCKDLARFVFHLIDQNYSGTFNVAGPLLMFDEFVDKIKQYTGSNAQFIEADRDLLNKHNVVMPLQDPGSASLNTTKAIKAGLTFRTLSESINDTMDWANTEGSSFSFPEAFTSEQEQALLLSIKQEML